MRHARLLRNRPRPRAAPLSAGVGRAAAVAGLPATAVIGIRYALERGRAGQPVGTALLGMVLAVAALCATAVFGASLTHLVSSPALYGAPFQAYFASDGTPGSQAMVTGPLLDSLRRDPAICADNPGRLRRGQRQRPARPHRDHDPGPRPRPAVGGGRPAARGDRDIMLGVATMRATGARVGGTVRVTVSDPAVTPHHARFRVIGRASLNAGTGGLGNGAVMTTSAFLGAQCPPGPEPGRLPAIGPAGHGDRGAGPGRPGPAGHAALARYTAVPLPDDRPGTPTVLVNFGESVNFPLLFGIALSVFGAATMMHLLLVSLARRPRRPGC